MKTAWLVPLLAVPWFAMGASAAAVGHPPPDPCLMPQPGAPVVQRPPAGGDDAAFAYDLSASRVKAQRRYLDMPPLKEIPRKDLRVAKDSCREEYRCYVTSIPIKINHCGVLAGHPTRLILTWSADTAGASEIEVRLSANGRKQFDWLRPGAPSSAGRRVVLVVPATDVRRRKRLDINIMVATRARGRNAIADYSIDGIELELLP